jgi:DEAD/DEAH box helicase domain-containing protein
MKLVVFDVETKKAFDDVGGYYPEKLGVSVSGVWYGEEGDTGTLRAFREEEFPEMFKIFETADRIVGFNSIDFDMPALSPYYVDLLAIVEKVVGHRVKLDALARETLGVQKGGHGLDAIMYYNEGRWDELITYCLQDVEITRDLYLYGLKHGQLKFKNKWNNLVEVSVDFTTPTVRDASVQVTLF